MRMNPTWSMPDKHRGLGFPGRDVVENISALSRRLNQRTFKNCYQSRLETQGYHDTCHFNARPSASSLERKKRHIEVLVLGRATSQQHFSKKWRVLTHI